MKYLLCKVNSKSYIPAYDEDLEKSLLVPNGSVVEVRVMNTRNVKLLRKFFALIRAVFEALPEGTYENTEDLRARVLIGVGACSSFIMENGTTAFMPWSISFDNMDDYKFRDLYPKLVDQCIAILIPYNNEELIKEIALNY